MKIPRVGLGTFRLKGRDLNISLKSALKVGFRHIDTAQIYDNEGEIGKFLKQAQIPRQDLFLTTKVWTNHLSKEDLIPSLQESLERLQTSYVDLTLIHWPSPKNQVPLKETLTELLRAKNKGMTKAIGVSNFTTEQLREAVDLIGKEHILTNQIEIHPFLQNRKVSRLCQELGIQVTAYMPLAYGEVIQSKEISYIAKKHKLTNAEVSLSWLLDQGFVVIPSSTNEDHLRSNFNTGVGILDEEDQKIISELEKNYRIANPDFSPQWD